MNGTAKRNMRRKARRVALQVLYEVDASEHTLEDSLRWVLERTRLDKRNIAFVNQLVEQVIIHSNDLDKEIERFATSWPLVQVPVVDRNILRIAFYEMEKSSETPPKVAINEAVELAKYFGSAGSQRFVNGVLGMLMQHHSDDLVTK